jgi:hypothetical protein
MGPPGSVSDGISRSRPGHRCSGPQACPDQGTLLNRNGPEAVEREFAAIRGTPPLIERLHAIQADFQAMKQSGGKAADKAFFDDLFGHS